MISKVPIVKNSRIKCVSAILLTIVELIICIFLLTYRHERSRYGNVKHVFELQNKYVTQLAKLGNDIYVSTSDKNIYIYTDKNSNMYHIDTINGYSNFELSSDGMLYYVKTSPYVTQFNSSDQSYLNICPSDMIPKSILRTDSYLYLGISNGTLVQCNIISKRIETVSNYVRVNDVIYNENSLYVSSNDANGVYEVSKLKIIDPSSSDISHRLQSSYRTLDSIVGIVKTKGKIYLATTNKILTFDNNLEYLKEEYVSLRSEIVSLSASGQTIYFSEKDGHVKRFTI